MHNLFLVYLFLLYLSISTCFGRLCTHHQEKELYLCDAWYLLFCMVDCLVCIPPCIPDSHPCRNNKHQGSHTYSCFSWWCAHSRPKHIEIVKYSTNKLCTKLALSTRLYNDARSPEHKTRYRSTFYAFNQTLIRHNL